MVFKISGIPKITNWNILSDTWHSKLIFEFKNNNVGLQKTSKLDSKKA
jgi:hypothetical protein